jgi:geranylgeranyl pyrophosphate synthase
MLGGDYLDTKDMSLALELINEATLVHDDIIDEETPQKEGASPLYKHEVKKSILTGDTLLSMGLMHAAKTGKPEVVGRLAETTLKVVQGMALQSQCELMSVDDYMSVIHLTSGSLFEAAAAFGGLAGSGKTEDVEKLAKFGYYFGNAYQIRDDIIDAFAHRGDDTPQENDPSLLLFYAIDSEKIAQEDREILLSIAEDDKLDMNFIRRVYKYTGALQKSIDKMEEYVSLAMGILNEYPNCDAKDSLKELLDQFNYDFTGNPKYNLDSPDKRPIKLELAQ